MTAAVDEVHREEETDPGTPAAAIGLVIVKQAMTPELSDGSAAEQIGFSIERIAEEES